jgi:hypothetical protein
MANLAMGAAAALIITAATANAEIIGFEDFSFDPTILSAAEFIPAGYHGFVWSGGYGTSSWVVSPNTATLWFGGPESYEGNNFGWSNGGENLSLAEVSGGSFDFVSIYAKIYSYEDPEATESDVVEGYSDGELTFSDSITLTTSYQLFELNFNNIDFLTTSATEHNVIFDDLDVSSGVPEPCAWALFTIGLFAAGAALRGEVGGRKRKSPAGGLG